MWRGGFRFEHICSRLFRLAVPHWFDRDSRFHIPLIEPDMQISRIRLSDKTHAFAHGTSCPSLFRRTSP